MKALKQWELISLFEQFVSDSYKGKRLKSDGRKIKSQTIDNYRYVLQLLRDFERCKSTTIRIQEVSGRNKQALQKEQRYWKKFYLDFTTFLYNNKSCYDNYAGSVIKVIRTFFGYLKKYRFMQISDCYKSFYVCQEDIPVRTLLPEQLSFLIINETFHQSLAPELQKSKAIFILGCTVALRFSDLMNIRPSDLEYTANGYYLSVKSIKTEKDTKVKLPEYAVKILKDFNLQRGKRKQLLPPICKSQFNKNIRRIAELAGWTQELSRTRNRRGKPVTIKKNKKEYRFCDHLSSHTMRRTAITSMLMLGMPEHIVRKISGHATNSKAFYRYVNLVQAYLDNQTDLVFNKLVTVPSSCQHLAS